MGFSRCLLLGLVGPPGSAKSFQPKPSTEQFLQAPSMYIKPALGPINIYIYIYAHTYMYIYLYMYTGPTVGYWEPQGVILPAPEVKPTYLGPEPMIRADPNASGPHDRDDDLKNEMHFDRVHGPHVYVYR